MSNDLQLPPERPMPEAALNNRANHLVASIAHAGGSNKQRSRWLWAAGAAAAVMATTGAAAAAYQALTEPTVTDELRCYSMPDLSTPGWAMTSPTMSSTKPVTSSEAVRACSAMWSSGMLVEGDRQQHEPYVNPNPAPVPPLEACVGQDGIVAVFPGKPDVCQSLGLSPLSP